MRLSESETGSPRREPSGSLARPVPLTVGLPTVPPASSLRAQGSRRHLVQSPGRPVGLLSQRSAWLRGGSVNVSPAASLANHCGSPHTLTTAALHRSQSLNALPCEGAHSHEVSMYVAVPSPSSQLFISVLLFVLQSVHLSVLLPVNLYVQLCPLVCLSLCPLVFPPIIHLSVLPSAHLPVILTAHLSVHLPVFGSVLLFVQLSVFLLVQLSVLLFVQLSICLRADTQTSIVSRDTDGSEEQLHRAASLTSPGLRQVQLCVCLNPLIAQGCLISKTLTLGLSESRHMTRITLPPFTDAVFQNAF